MSREKYGCFLEFWSCVAEIMFDYDVLKWFLIGDAVVCCSSQLGVIPWICEFDMVEWFISSFSHDLGEPHEHCQNWCCVRDCTKSVDFKSHF